MQNTINNIKASMQQARDCLGQPLYDARETRAIIDLLLEDVCGITRVNRVLHPDRQLTPEQTETLLRVAVLLGQGIPVQQALGYAWFCERRFVITPDVLIPRPETAELVDWIVADATQHCADGCQSTVADDLRTTAADGSRISAVDGSRFAADGSRITAVEGSQSTSVRPALRILDIGTGSGCIALTLARLIHNSEVVAIDLSTAALDVARRNADQLKVDNVRFAACDILAVADSRLSYQQSAAGEERVINNGVDNPQQPDIAGKRIGIANAQTGIASGRFGVADAQPDIACECFDIIVSNPPYICQRESAEMSDLVTHREPSMALFVPDDDPLLFYHAIARYALTHLRPGGALYFEINAAYGEATCQLLRDLGYGSVELRQDCNGRDRMVRAAKF